jgi:tRNA G37 N-methylase Trm5
MKFDLEKTFFCSWLKFERKWLIDSYIDEMDMIFDVFCGIGPLSLLSIISKNTICYSNDLNPDSI